MDIFVLVSWKTELHQRAWAVEDCPFCQGLEPARVEERVWTFSVYLVPLIRANKGWIARCNFCERPIKETAPAPSVPLEKWSPADGLAPLFRQLGYKGKVVLRRGTVDDRLRSMLRTAHDATSLNQMDVTFGMSTGAIFGAILGGLLGYLSFQLRLFPGATDGFKFAFLGVLVGLVVGLVIGSVTQWLLRRVSMATQIIAPACANNKINMNRLVELSSEFNGSVQQAVLDVRDELLPDG